MQKTTVAYVTFTHIRKGLHTSSPRGVASLHATRKGHEGATPPPPDRKQRNDHCTKIRRAERPFMLIKFHNTVYEIT